MKATFAKNVTLVDHIAAEAGSPEAQFDARICALYSAYHHILKAGNRTQWNMVEATVAKMQDIKAVKESLSATRLTAEVKHAHAVYLAYGAALAHVGVPGVMKGATPEAIEAQAADMAQEFATIVQVALTPETKAVKTEDEKAADKAAKEAKVQEAEAAQAAAIRAEAEKLAQASVVTLADMVAIVANAARTGLLDADALATLDSALDAVAANVELIPVQTETDTPVHA